MITTATRKESYYEGAYAGIPRVNMGNVLQCKSYRKSLNKPAPSKRRPLNETKVFFFKYTPSQKAPVGNAAVC